MPKVAFDSDEWYPVWFIRERSTEHSQIEVSQEWLDKYERVMSKFDELQADMKELESKHWAENPPTPPRSPGNGSWRKEIDRKTPNLDSKGWRSFVKG